MKRPFWTEKLDETIVFSGASITIVVIWPILATCIHNLAKSFSCTPLTAFGEFLRVVARFSL